MGMTIAPRVEVYTTLACNKHKPEYSRHIGFCKQLGLPYDDNHTTSPVSNLQAFSGDVKPALNYTVAQFSANDHFTMESEKEDKNQCASDPDVQAAVAKLTTGKSQLFCR